jgi:hypothetical protein
VSFFCFLQSPRIQNIVEKEITSYLLEARLGRQLLDGVPAVPQDALVAVDVRDLGAAGGGVDVAVFFFLAEKREIVRVGVFSVLASRHTETSERGSEKNRRGSILRLAWVFFCVKPCASV